jgi:uncharacterized protein YidB (DUF937 family)
MALLDQVLGSLMSGGGSSSSPLQGVLMSMLGGGQQGAMGTGMGGGLGSLLGTLQQAGLGDIAQSWVGHGANQPVSPEQLHGAFGDDQVQSMAAQSGMAPHDFLSQLSQHLPNVVNALTPNGRLPDQDPGPF